MSEIEKFGADHGGTNIVKPLTDAQNWASEGLIKKRIFILTDGQVSNPSLVVEAARERNEHIRVFTFGLGSGCDVNLVRQTAEAGRGTCSLVKDDAPDLNGLVIRALQNAMEPSLKACFTKWNNDAPMPLLEVFRNQSVMSSKMMSKAEFLNLRFGFTSEIDPLTLAPISLEFGAQDFIQLTGEAAKGLFKQAVLGKIHQTEDAEVRSTLSVAYQTLCDDTALVGVIKQTDKATGELKEVSVQFGKKQDPIPVKFKHLQSNAMHLGHMAGRLRSGLGGAPQPRGAVNQLSMQKGLAMPRARAKAAAPMQMNKMSPDTLPHKSQRQRVGTAMSARGFCMPSGTSSREEDGMEEKKQMKMKTNAPPRGGGGMQVSQSLASLQAVSKPQSMRMAQASMSSSNEMETMKKKGKSKNMEMTSSSLKSKAAAAPLRKQEESKSEFAAAPSNPFENLISQQHTSGYWPAAAKQGLTVFLKDEQTEDGDVREALAAVNLNASFELEQVYTTLLAIYILMEKFGDREDEWTLLSRKAKTFLREAGIDKPDKILRLFSDIEVLN